jgi:cytochrome c biogenesis protein CcmG, thiol:disulfide interchange protein DsbE
MVVALVATFRGRLFHRAEPLRAAEKRGALPAFTLRELDGGTWHSKDHRGEVMLVNFWATWCPPCREETPDLVELQRRFGSRGFTVIGISMDDNPKEVLPGFVRRFKVNYPILVPAADSSLADAIESLPTSFLIDRSGRVAGSFVGQIPSGQLAGQIEALLKEPVAGQQARVNVPEGN